MIYHTVPNAGQKSYAFAMMVLRYAMSAVIISESLSVKRESEGMIEIKPRKRSDRGGWLAMPLVENVLRPSDKTWKKTTCPDCGRECWDRPLPEGFTDDMFEGKLCTLCALQKAAGRGE